MNKLILITFLSLLLNACSFSDYVPEVPTLSLIKPYKADINQGTVLSRLSINQLKIGMSKKQVQELIGTPSVIDPFHNNQWDYINHSMMGSGEVIRYRLILKFEGVKLVNINTDGISSLPELTDKQKKLQETRIAEEKAKILEEKRLAEEKAKHAEQEKIKAKALEEKAKKLEEENKAKELEEKAKELEEENKAKELEEKAKELEEKNKTKELKEKTNLDINSSK
ncbi:outer membrane protein assembly factor BamE [bacterium endosymbiont of Bathymodiolus sp. 5 South]|uniref:outer membrane protein assembly factor BamE n=1 Tax=bacterium endosymbiont of Bathymodiolus sp. 5 South TaxID=1181670 RepID=UPI0010BC8180|nr:outer membrane protein assembly factor BamE [bacterium endosymbiont of Bathymodiolus sp. 5 South]CAC9650193.1 hypothetical protein [uncultured Gammaproteobacteria bacterium]SHN92855.1 hypothetical protein BCLUESOX_125 [bacterium endosymbiont of Bathymodiolus sp. 5 South]VVH56121.1 hypothetical protein BSPCLSOX_1020 [uncultured Gammaproteobacteria bacterium]